MNAPSHSSQRRCLTLAGCCLALGLVSCASGPEKPKPQPIPADPGLVGVRLSWQGKMGRVESWLQPAAVQGRVYLASAEGEIVVLDARSGGDVWRARTDAPLIAGVGSDGRHVAVVNARNELVVFELGRELWRAALGARVFAAPLVAGGRVFVSAGDHSVWAFDATVGSRLWHVTQVADALVLRQPSLLAAHRNTLLVGVNGRLQGWDPQQGRRVWDLPVAMGRASTEIERLADVVAGAGRDGATWCVRAFQSAVACIDVDSARVLWQRRADGAVGLVMDDERVFGAERDGRVQAWRRSDGEPLWQQDLLRWRELSALALAGRSVVLADETGTLYWLARQDGRLLTLRRSDGTPIRCAPVLSQGTLVAVTQGGTVLGFVPD
ncbi:MAG: outer membrane protein assembly factor BamB [Rhodoferax sp.]